jgi:glutathione S-transferase
MTAVLFHFPFDPGSRSARLALGEARIEVEETAVRPWEPDCPVRGPQSVRHAAGAAGHHQAQPLTLCEANAILGWVEDSRSRPS